MSDESKPTHSKLTYANRVLLFIIVACNAYVLLLPLLPRVEYEIRQVQKPIDVSVQKPETVKRIDRSTNRLILPSIQLEEPIIEGSDPSNVHKGVWRRPQTSTPTQGSNTVLVGHRFTYNGSAVFYNLDKLNVGDSIFTVYDGEVFRYQVTEEKVVPPTAVEIEAPTHEDILTIYTCTPITTAENRLVFVAKKVETL